ncbi:hypothetical protein MHM93_14545 [Pseudoalteromonas sp. MM17-2]|uniref:ParB N-terminal domain-containing protein n=1 Tax=Pseudoalteromonas sp. MM17-2 TaxID=2917753 RepID=UPI001EF50D7E|nr:ParB N-terminal domain-containing protein [Pseudoalteromonas sp. MM17-2]MCG7545397.1 hypothetical protein [Pseudoalteromonas sp. MM17-2]
MDMYTTKRGKNKLPPLKGKEAIEIPSPVTGEPITFRIVTVPSSEVNTKTYKCRFNRRSGMHLSMGAVLDILPSIQKDGRNTQPVLGQTDGDKVEILAGMRRRKAVSLLDDGELVILTTDKKLTDEEKRRFALTSDTYQEPTTIDLGFTLIEEQAAAKSAGEKVTHDELAAIFEVSTGKVSEAISFASLPSELYSLFPSLDMISYSFLRKANKAHKASPQQFRKGIEQAISSGLRVSVSGEDDKNSLKAKCKDLEKSIIELVEPPKKKPTSPVTRWSKVKAPEGVKTTVKRNGKVQIEIDESKLDAKIAEKIYKLLNQ